MCDSPNLVKNFAADQYMGTWYTVAHSKGMPFNPDSWSCGNAIYGALETDGSFKLYNSSETKHQVGPRYGVNGTGQASPDISGAITVSINNQVVNEPNYFIIDTDYDNYAIVYNCSSKFNGL